MKISSNAFRVRKQFGGLAQECPADKGVAR
jgi:hypothetical protein